MDVDVDGGYGVDVTHIRCRWKLMYLLILLLREQIKYFCFFVFFFRVSLCEVSVPALCFTRGASCWRPTPKVLQHFLKLPAST